MEERSARQKNQRGRCTQGWIQIGVQLCQTPQGSFDYRKSRPIRHEEE
jgi:hypothetical protein